MTDERWIEEVLQQIPLPEQPNGDLWRMFTRELLLQIWEYEEGERASHQPTRYDFCILHSCHPSDKQVAEELKRLLVTSLGLFGCTLSEIEIGDNTLQSAATMMEGSTKIIVLASPYFNQPGIPKFIFQDALVCEIQQVKWRRRIIPAILPHLCKNHLPFGLRGIQGITLGDDPRTVELISGIINVESQMQVRAAQRRSESILHHRLRRQREQKVGQVKQVVQGLRRQFGDHHDPTLQLQQMTEQLHQQLQQEPTTTTTTTTGGFGTSTTTTTNPSPSCEQLINVSGCSNVSMGPSFHFLVAPSSNSSSTSQNPEVYQPPSTTLHQSTSSSHQSPSTSHQSPSTSFQTGNTSLQSTSTSLQSGNTSFTTLYSS